MGLSDDDNPYALLEGRLGYAFLERRRLESALSHKSYVNENPEWGRPNNERLEFLGDAVLDLVVSHLLMDAAPERSEGDLSKLRGGVVSEPSLAEVALELGLGDWLFLGRGEEHSGGRRKPSVLADALEAVLAAVYLDGGFEAAFTVVRHLFEGKVRLVGEVGAGDFKTRLQELAAKRRLPVRYTVIAESGPDHDKVFEVAAVVGEEVVARATGKTKKEAEQRAAEAALPHLLR